LEKNYPKLKTNKQLPYLLIRNINSITILDFFNNYRSIPKHLTMLVTYNMCKGKVNIFKYIIDMRVMATLKSYTMVWALTLWYEREILEFSSLILSSLIDSRNLLLPYKNTYISIKQKFFQKTSHFYKNILLWEQTTVNL